MAVANLMSKAVVTVEMDDTLKMIKHIFDSTNFHHLLVINDDKLIGIISDRDLLKALSPNLDTVSETPKDLALLNKRAHQIMTRNPITLLPSAKVYDAVDIFHNNNISAIPIVNNDKKAVGILSWRDVIRALAVIRKNKKMQ